ncbi:MAG: EamA family transporter [Treponema sp.]|nr:MAG: EamA family transporter [Treponema sp.]
MKPLNQKQISARLALLLLCILWGSTFVAISSTKDFFNPSFLLALRFSTGFVVLSIIFAKRYKNLNTAYIKAGVWAGISSFLGYLPQALAITTFKGDPGRSSFLVATYCVLVPFISWFFNKKRPDKFNIIAAFICLFGIGIISLPDLIAGKSVQIGWSDALSLISSLVFAFNLVILERFAPKLDASLFSIMHFLFAAICAWIFTLLFEDNSTTIWNLRSIFTLLYLAIPCTALTVLLQTYGQKYTPASTAALFFALESVFGLTFSVMLGYEKLTVNLIAGGLLIIFSIILTETKLQFRVKTKQ